MVDGLTNSLVDAASAMQAAQLKSQFSVSAFKKGLDAQEHAALQLLETAQITPAPAVDGGQLIDMLA